MKCPICKAPAQRRRGQAYDHEHRCDNGHSFEAGKPLTERQKYLRDQLAEIERTAPPKDGWYYYPAQRILIWEKEGRYVMVRLWTNSAGKQRMYLNGREKVGHTIVKSDLIAMPEPPGELVNDW